MISILSPKIGDIEEFNHMGEENPNNDSFKSQVALALGVGINDEINFENREVMYKFAKAVTMFEGNNYELPDVLLRNAVDEAFKYRNIN
jgi:hypothetical protein